MCFSPSENLVSNDPVTEVGRLSLYDVSGIQHVWRGHNLIRVDARNSDFPLPGERLSNIIRTKVR